MGDDVMNQPTSSVIDERLECQLGLASYISCQAVNSLMDTLARFFFPVYCLQILICLFV